MRSGRRLLVLDDDQAVASIVGECAERLGYQVLVTGEATSFFVAVEQWRPTHIVIDLVLPTADGVEILTRLSRDRCEAQIILISGVGPRVLDCARRSASEHGLNVAGALSKPFRLRALQELLTSPTKRRIEPRPLGGQSISLTNEEIAEAIHQEQFFLEYQPTVDLRSGATVAFEALVRWRHAVYGIVYPDGFIPSVERSRHIDEFTKYVFERGVEWFSTVPDASRLSLAVNISARNLRALDFVDRLCETCATYGVDPARLTLELTETSALVDAGLGLDILTRLRLKGFNLSIDDFGTGYASMAALARLPFSEIKIDRSFINRVTRSTEALKIVRGIVTLSDSLGLGTVAEGVEDEQTAALLGDLGCKLAQGYYFARPMDGRHAAKFHGCRRQTPVGRKASV